jgi:hypothetical protein
MIQPLTRDSLASLRAHAPGPCLSLYQPTHRHHPLSAQDSIRFGNLVKELERSLQGRCSASDARTLLDPFASLERDSAFWHHSLDGLAVFGAPGRFEVFRLQRDVPEVAIVADGFHTKPLRRLLQTMDRYQVLGLTRRTARLFEGNRETLDEVPLHADVPATIEDALGSELTEPHLTVASYGGVGTGTANMRHGHGSKKDETDVDTERFFRVVDRAVFEHHSRPSGLPLVLAALAEHHSRFAHVSRNPNLVSERIAVNPDGVSMDDLRARVWSVLEPQMHARIRGLVDRFLAAKATEQGVDGLSEVGRAIAEGRAAVLLVEAERRIGGRVDDASGVVTPAALENPYVDDVLDELAERAERMGAEAHVIPASVMPTDSGAAAILRY